MAIGEAKLTSLPLPQGTIGPLAQATPPDASNTDREEKALGDVLDLEDAPEATPKQQPDAPPPAPPEQLPDAPPAESAPEEGTKLTDEADQQPEPAKDTFEGAPDAPVAKPVSEGGVNQPPPAPESQPAADGGKKVEKKKVEDKKAEEKKVEKKKPEDKKVEEKKVEEKKVEKKKPEEKKALPVEKKEGDLPWVRVGLTSGSGAADGLNGVTTNSPAMESLLNSHTPSLNAVVGLGRSARPIMLGRGWALDRLQEIGRLSPLLNAGPATFDPDLNIRYTRSYFFNKDMSTEETDENFAVRGGLNTYFDTGIKGFTPELYLNGGVAWTERAWPSVGLPSGREFAGEIGAAVNLIPWSWLELRPYFEVEGNSFAYYIENFGRSVTAGGLAVNLGTEIYYKGFAEETPYAPTVGLRGETTVHGTQESPITAPPSNGTTEGDLSAFELGVIGFWGREVQNLSLSFDYKNREIENFVPVSKYGFTLAGDIPYVGRLALTGGQGWGTLPYHRIDMPYFVDVKLRVADYLSPDLGPVAFDWGLMFGLAKYEDRVREGNPQYSVWSVGAVAEASF